MENTPHSFTKTEATRRTREIIRQQWPNTRGRKVEIQYIAATPGQYPDGISYPLSKGLEPEHRKHGAQFRVMLSTVGTWGELRDLFRMNLGTPDTPPHLAR